MKTASRKGRRLGAEQCPEDALRIIKQEGAVSEGVTDAGGEEKRSRNLKLTSPWNS